MYVAGRKAAVHAEIFPATLAMQGGVTEPFWSFGDVVLDLGLWKQDEFVFWPGCG